MLVPAKLQKIFLNLASIATEQTLIAYYYYFFYFLSFVFLFINVFFFFPTCPRRISMSSLE